jgi:hypothetical protein
MNNNKFKKLKKKNFYNSTIFLLITYSCLFLFEIFFGYNITNYFYIKLISNIIGNLFNYDLIINYSIKYSTYFQNLLRYISIFLFQHIFLKIFIFDYKILSYQNMLQTNSYILIYFLFDVILDVYIKDTEKRKAMIIDISKTFFGFIIIEVLINKKLEMRQFIYILILSFGLFIYYNYFSNSLHLKN